MFDMDDEFEIDAGYLPSRNESQTQRERVPLVSNHSGYGGRPGSENWEHDDTGNFHNWSGCYDMMIDPIAEHEGWQEGYDY